MGKIKVSTGLWIAVLFKEEGAMALQSLQEVVDAALERAVDPEMFNLMVQIGMSEAGHFNSSQMRRVIAGLAIEAVQARLLKALRIPNPKEFS